MSKALRPVSITANGRTATFDALMKSSDDYESTVPSFPIEAGYEVSDSIIIKSPALSMTLYLAKTPLTWARANGMNRVEQNVAMIENLYFQKATCVVDTTDKSYTDMAIEKMTIAKSEELGYDRQIDITFKKIIITSTKTTSIPDSYGKSGATAESAGAASTTQNTVSGSNASESSNSQGSSSKSSILYGLAGKVGLV